MKFKSKKGFTLIELLVVIVIIGILATLATVALSAAKVKARDAKRISDIKQMQTALELYYNEESTYPPTTALVAGQALVGAVSGKTFIGKVPAGPNSGETYTYNQINGGTSYTLGYTLEKPVNEFAAGLAIALPGSINNQCTPSCGGKVCGSNGCGGFCAPNSCSGATPYCKINGTACVDCNTDSDCSDTPATPYCKVNSCSATPDFSVACTLDTTLGSACGGGWLICKPYNTTNDSSCGTDNTYYVVAERTDLGANIAWSTTVCAGYRNGFSDWTLPRLSNATSDYVTSIGYPINNEMCQLMKRSNKCNSQTSSWGCSGGCLPLAPISGLGSAYYWSSNAYSNERAWLQNTDTGNQNDAGKTNTNYWVRCVRRFN